MVNLFLLKTSCFFQLSMFVLAGLDLAWLGLAGLGLAWLGLAWLGLAVCLSIWSVRLSSYLSVCLSVCLSGLSVCLSMSLCVCLSCLILSCLVLVCLPVFLSAYLTHPSPVEHPCPRYVFYCLQSAFTILLPVDQLALVMPK